jgi:hypothetical protein
MGNRWACTVLDEMRDCLKHYNFAVLPSLIEEMQIICNRMEAAIQDINDIQSYTERRAELKDEIKELKKQRNKLNPEAKDDHYSI